MNKLLYKEFKLCLVMQIPLFFVFALMLLIPSYPYLVAGFFACNAIFYSFSQAVVDNDVLFSTLLPVSKAEIVRGKMRFVVLIHLAMLALYVPVIFLRHKLMADGNAAGVDASLTLLAAALVLFALFYAVFFPRYYRAPYRVGKHFLVSTLVIFGYVIVFEGFMIVCGAARQANPFFEWVETHLDCFPATGEAWTAQLIALAVGAAIYAGLNALTLRRAIRSFEELDL